MTETFATTYGCMFISFMITAVFFGAGLLLVCQYFSRRNQDDPWSLRFLVGVLGSLAIIQYASFCAWAYTDLIDRFGLMDKLDSMPHTALVQLQAIYLLGFCTQCFFSTRIWLLTKRSIWYTAPVAILALLQISAGIAQTTLAAKGGTFSNLVHTKVITTIQSGATAACDLSITCILCWVLHGNRTGMKATDTILDRLILYTINRGAITSIAALLNMILFIWRPEAMIFMIPLLPSGHLYVISVVATLNSRKSLRDNLSQSRDRSDGVSVPLGPLGHSSVSNKTGETNGGVHIPIDFSNQTTSVVTWGTIPEENDDNAMHKGKASPV